MICPESSPRFPSSRISTSKAGPFSSPTATTAALCKEFLPENEEGLEDLLQSAVRIALEYRMDLMNDRAQLYDALAADPRHGQCSERRFQSRPHQQRLHTGRQQYQPVCAS